MIWVCGEAEYFCEGVLESDLPVGQISGRVGWVEPLAKPITVAQNMMGIASLHPSYVLVKIDGYAGQARV